MAETEYRAKFYDFEEVSGADNLILQGALADIIDINAPGEHKRGTLLMSTSDGSYIPAASAGLESAKHIALLGEDVNLEDGQNAKVSAYVCGVFSAKSVILEYETEDDDHAELIEEVRPRLRLQSILLRG